MFIQTESTPNPATMRFLPGESVLDAGIADFPDAETAARSPLARRLFASGHVAGVLLGPDFITVTRPADARWEHIKPAILGAIMEHFQSGEAAIEGGPAIEHTGESSGENADLIRRIKEVLDARVRPAVAQDGGDITFHGYDRGVVYLNMKGSCAGCPSATITLKMGIENLLRHFIPEVTEVRAVAA
ncbi:MAG: NifU family protein [Rubellimicrobium sp.]|nr:NifU family protein [Rubellimicrobium sp.]